MAISYNRLGSNGRLGNQMFQYAGLRGIAAKHNYSWLVPPPNSYGDANYGLFECFEMSTVTEENFGITPYQSIATGCFEFNEKFFDSVLEDEEIVKRATAISKKYDELLAPSDDVKQQLFDAVLATQITEGLIFYTSRYTEYKTIIETQIIREDKLDTIRGWLLERAKEGSWVYYSYLNDEIVAVDLSDYIVRKDDYTGDLLFYKRTEECPDDNKQNEPPLGWHTDIVKPKRPKSGAKISGLRTSQAGN